MTLGGGFCTQRQAVAPPAFFTRAAQGTKSRLRDQQNGLGAAAEFNRWENPAGRHHQARQPLSASRWLRSCVALRVAGVVPFCLKLCKRQSRGTTSRSKNRHTALRLPGMRFFRIAATISSNVKSGCSTISPNKNSACSSSGEVLPPTRHGRNAAGFFPPLRYRSAASRRDAPASMASITRARKSLEYGLGIDCPLRIESMPPHSNKSNEECAALGLLAAEKLRLQSKICALQDRCSRLLEWALKVRAAVHKPIPWD